MDPISVSGLAISVVSLTFQIFSGCVAGYQLFLEAKGMPKRYQYLRLRLRMEQLKLVDWAETAQISERDETMGVCLRSNRHVINDILHQIETLILDASCLSRRYNLRLITEELKTNKPDDAEIQSLPQIERLESAKVFRKALDFVARSRKYPAQLRWATFDYKSFESLVSELSKMNDSLSYFLETGQKMQLLRTQQDTFLQVLQVSNRMDHLFELLSSMTKPESGRMTTKSPEEEEPDIVARATHAEKLMRLAKFKALAVAIETGVTYAGPLLSLPGSSAKFHIDLNLLELADQRPATNRQTRSLAKYGSASVWIEWRYYTPLGIEDGPPAHVVERVTKLVTLLGHDVNPPEFRIPKCYGYVLQLEQQRFGFVFENPNRTSGQIPISLRTRFASDEMPSLTERVEMAVAIAESVWYLHATNWLHKGLRSDNIVFLDANRPAAPSLCGFEYSRPARTGELTERPSFEPRDNFYRHPKAQYDLPTENGREFKKIYDIYSLGVVLLEIGLWAPIETILGITVDEHIEASTIRRIRSDLLEGGYLTRLDAQVGRAYAAATRVCLASDFDIDFGLPDEEVGARLQSEFGDKVIKKLAGISV